MPTVDELVQDAQKRMDASVEHTRTEFNTVRTGRASAALLDRIQIDYYGQQTPLKQLATINVPEPRMLTIQPFDPTSIKAIEKALLESDLGLTPSNDGKVIRLPMPQPTEERRGRASGAHRVEVLVRRLHRLVHALGGIAEKIVDQRTPPSGVNTAGVPTTVPRCSPSITRPMLPGASSNTWIGR